MIPPCEPGPKVGDGLVVVTRRREMLAALAQRLRGFPVHRCEPCSCFGSKAPADCPLAVLAVVDLLEIMVAPRRFPLALAEGPLEGMVVVAFRGDEREMIAALNEDLLVHPLDLLHDAALGEMVDQASPRYQSLFLEMHRISARRVRRFLSRSRDGEPLTGRETEILRFLANGHGTGEILHMLRIRPQTLKNHMGRMFQKLGVSSRAEAVARFLGSHSERPPTPR